MGIDVNESGDSDAEVSKRIMESFDKISSLKETDNLLRCNTLKEVEKIILSNEENLRKISLPNIALENAVSSLIKTLTDNSEKCREISATLLNHVFQRLCIVESALPNLFKVLALRLNKTDEREQSEEVRLMQIHMLYNIVENYEGDLLQHLSDISTILSACIIDEYPEIRRKSCECLSLLAAKQHKHFHMMGSTFLKPLLSTIVHQHLKTRALCIDAIGSIADCLNNEELKQAIPNLAQRLFDRSPLVRISVTKVIGKMLISLKDRYSYFHLLIPLALSSLYDDVEEIRHLAQDVWSKAGDQYLKENENDYKDLIDFPRPNPPDYPTSVCRPNLGCRILVQRNIFNILPALLNDLKDWSAETRIKASKVLHAIILHSEEKITIKLSSAVEGLMLAAKDEDKEVIEQTMQSTELLGYFIDPNHLIDTILKLTYQSPSAEHLSILAASLRGHKGSLPPECFTGVCKFLADPTVARLRQAKEQANLLLCIEGLLMSGNEITPDASYNLFTILSSVSGLASHDSIFNKAADLMKQLAELLSISVEILFQQHSVILLQGLCNDNELWTSQSPEMPIFIFIIRSGNFDKDVIEIIIPVLINTLHPSKDAKIRSKILSVLIPVFQRLSSSEFEMFSGKIIELIRTGIFPNLNWSAGKTASALRTVAAASLYEIINKSSMKKEMLQAVGNELLLIMETLLDDDEVPTRLLSCKILEIILPILKDCIDELKVHRTCHEVLRCMDDVSDDIRLMTLRILKAYVTSFPVDYDWKLYHPYLKHMFENILVHMDDKNEKVKTGVSNLLKEVGHIAPDVLLDEIESKKYLMSSSEFCDDLINHIKCIKL